MNPTELEALRPYEPAMREWVADCEWRDIDAEDAQDWLPFAAIVEGVRRHYDGGIEGFRRDSADVIPFPSLAVPA